MSGITWRWEEKDFGFRFRSGKGRRAAEHYQARNAGEFYVVPAARRKLEEKHLDDLAEGAGEPAVARVVANPWRNYELDWDWIVTEDGICLNLAGCLDEEEINRREDEGVQRALELVAQRVQRAEPAPLTLGLLRQIHRELMGAIYPFAGEWRSMHLTKGEGLIKWPLPPGGIQPLADVIERDVFSRSPVISGDDEVVFTFASEAMNEILALHPFREGNGRTAFLVGNLILMQNDMLPLSVYERRADEQRYFAACEAGRVLKDYAPLAQLLAEWQDGALERWEETHG